MARGHTYSGQCHCGAISVSLPLTKGGHGYELRACQCGFCLRQGAATVSDPDDHVEIQCNPSAWRVYRLALRSAQPLVCGDCGVYIGTILRQADRMWSAVNVRGTGMKEFDPARAQPVPYAGETLAARIARGKAGWTPTTISISSRSPDGKNS
jgi:hypothetical protein